MTFKGFVWIWTGKLERLVYILCLSHLNARHVLNLENLFLHVTFFLYLWKLPQNIVIKWDYVCNNGLYRFYCEVPKTLLELLHLLRVAHLLFEHKMANKTQTAIARRIIVIKYCWFEPIKTNVYSRNKIRTILVNLATVLCFDCFGTTFSCVTNIAVRTMKIVRKSDDQFYLSALKSLGADEHIKWSSSLFWSLMFWKNGHWALS